MSLTVYFDGQFWIGLVEWECEEGIRYARHVFGAEPTDMEVLDFVRHGLDDALNGTTVALSVDDKAPRISNPKRAAREAAKVLRQPPVSTKAQEALARQHELNKLVSHRRTRTEREEQAEHKRDVARHKAMERHRGH